MKVCILDVYLCHPIPFLMSPVAVFKSSILKWGQVICWFRGEQSRIGRIFSPCWTTKKKCALSTCVLSSKACFSTNSLIAALFSGVEGDRRFTIHGFGTFNGSFKPSLTTLKAHRSPNFLHSSAYSFSLEPTGRSGAPFLFEAQLGLNVLMGCFHLRDDFCVNMIFSLFP